MKKLTAHTVLAGLLTCVCVTGMSQTASAQFFSNDLAAPQNNRTTAPAFHDAYGRQVPQQWQGLTQGPPRFDQRYLPTNAIDGSNGSLTPDGYRLRQECADGQCQHNHRERNSQEGTASYQGRRSRSSGLADGRGYQPGRTLTTGWDPSASNAIDPNTGMPTERSYRGNHSHANGEGRHGLNGCRDCSNPNCACVDGQCTCPAGRHSCKDGQCEHGRRNVPSGYSDFSLTRRNNTNPGYLPAARPYLN